jgi:hypothetical protein
MIYAVILIAIIAIFISVSQMSGKSRRRRSGTDSSWGTPVFFDGGSNDSGHDRGADHGGGGWFSGGGGSDGGSDGGGGGSDGGGGCGGGGCGGGGS